MMASGRAGRRALLGFLGRAMAVTVAALCVDARGEERDAFAGEVDRDSLVRAAIGRNPALAGGKARAQAAEAMAEAEGKLPPPEAMAQLWQVPLAKPYSVLDAQMFMVGVTQQFPASSVRDAKAQAGRTMARVEDAMVADRELRLARDAAHTFYDYREAFLRYRVHLEHHAVAEQSLSLARARLGGGASLVDLTDAELELARNEADTAVEASKKETARARINGLLGRDTTAPLGPPRIESSTVPLLALDELVAMAREKRPDLHADELRRRAAADTARAAEREATVPSFGVGAFYFVPTAPMWMHGYGVSATMSLPWLWGAADARARAAASQSLAAQKDAEGTRYQLAVDVATNAVVAVAAGERVRILREKVLPATARSEEAVRAGYVTGATKLSELLKAQRSVVDARMELLEAETMLDHALVDLEWAVGARIPRAPAAPSVPRSSPRHHE